MTGQIQMQAGVGSKAWLDLGNIHASLVFSSGSSKKSLFYIALSQPLKL
jgi:hypothetical protein